jgi:hypothetical protein
MRQGILLSLAIAGLVALICVFVYYVYDPQVWFE